MIQNAKPLISPEKFNFRGRRLYRVTEIINEDTIKLNTGLKVRFLGVRVNKNEEALNYLKKYILGKEIFLKLEENKVIDENTIMANVYLKNMIFINSYLIKSGMAAPI